MEVDHPNGQRAAYASPEDATMFHNGVYDVPKRKPGDMGAPPVRGHQPGSQVDYGHRGDQPGLAGHGGWTSNGAYEQSGSDMSDGTQASPPGQTAGSAPHPGHLSVEDMDTQASMPTGLYSNGTYEHLSENLSDASSDTVTHGRNPVPPSGSYIEHHGGGGGRGGRGGGMGAGVSNYNAAYHDDVDMMPGSSQASSGFTSRSNSGRMDPAGGVGGLHGGGGAWGGDHGMDDGGGFHGGGGRQGSARAGRQMGGGMAPGGGGGGPIIMKSNAPKRGMEGMFSSILGGGHHHAAPAPAQVNSTGSFKVTSLRDQYGGRPGGAGGVHDVPRQMGRPGSAKARRGQLGTAQMQALLAEEAELAHEGDYRFDTTSPTTSPTGMLPAGIGGAKGGEAGFRAGPVMVQQQQQRGSVFQGSMLGGGGGGSDSGDSSDDDDVVARPMLAPPTGAKAAAADAAFLGGAGQDARMAPAHAAPAGKPSALAAPHEAAVGAAHRHHHQHAAAVAIPRSVSDAGSVRSQVDADRLAFLTAPGARGAMTQCFVQRSKGRMGTWPTFKLFLEDGETFLLSARRRKKSKTSNFLISLDAGDLSRDSEHYFGKLRSNYVGTEYTLYDGGESVKKMGGAEAEGLKEERREVCAIRFKQTALTKTGGPRLMTVVVPEPTAGSPLEESRGATLVESYQSIKGGSRPDRPVMILKNKKPTFDPNLKAYCLDFSGRVTEASVKNFQLCVHDMAAGKDDEGKGPVALQFGKMGGDRFALDYSWPLSPLQALGIALGSVDGKLCYTL